MVKYKIIRSNRKNVSIEIKNDLTIVVRAPRDMSDLEVYNIVCSKGQWLDDNIVKVKKRVRRKKKGGFSQEELADIKRRALETIPSEVAVVASAMGMTGAYNRVTLRFQKSRWGSCSSRANLNFNCLLVLCPYAVRRYVVVHELCHLRHMNHSKYFWDMVRRCCPDYKSQQQWLVEEGIALINRLRQS